MKINKKTLIIVTMCSLIVLALIIVVGSFLYEKNDKKGTAILDEMASDNEEQTTSKIQIIFEDGETLDVDVSVEESYTTSDTNESGMAESNEETSSINMSETVPYNNDIAETKEGHTTKDIQATTSPHGEDETTTFIFVNNDTTSSTTAKETSTTIVPTTKPTQTTTKEPTKEEETTKPISTVSSGWKPEMVTEFYTYFKKYINTERILSSHLKKRYDAICDKYVGTTNWGCSSMITELESQWEVCTCDYCVDSKVYDLTYSFWFSDAEYYGAEKISVSGYGDDAVERIVNNRSKAIAHYAYVNIYYDADTNTSTAYICSQGNIKQAYNGHGWYDGDVLVNE